MDFKKQEAAASSPDGILIKPGVPADSLKSRNLLNEPSDLEDDLKPKLRKGQAYSVKDLLKAQEADSILQAIKTLWEDDERPLEGFSKSVAKRARSFFKGRENRLFYNPQGIKTEKL